jgi:hypothetical protein
MSQLSGVALAVGQRFGRGRPEGETTSSQGGGSWVVDNHYFADRP